MENFLRCTGAAILELPKISAQSTRQKISRQHKFHLYNHKISSIFCIPMYF